MTTITISAWVFGDQLTELNIVGVFITMGGIATYTYHKYQKSISTPTPLDSHGRPVDPENGGEPHLYSRAPTSHEETRLAGEPSPGLYTHTNNVPLDSLQRSKPIETDEERTNRLRDDFEGWDRRDEDWSEADEDEAEADLEEVEARRRERDDAVGKDDSTARSWGAWWDKSL